MLQVVWFKRDFWLNDHAALTAAAVRGPILPLFVYEPALWAGPERSGRQDMFMRGAMASLARDLRARGAALCIRVGDVARVLEALRGELGPFDLHAREETGDLWTFERDRDVQA